MLVTREELNALLGSAEIEGWTRAADALPPAGERVDVMHVLSRSYDTDGEVDAEGRWHCCNGFVLPNMMFVWNPTHWRASQSEAHHDR